MTNTMQGVRLYVGTCEQVIVRGPESPTPPQTPLYLSIQAEHTAVQSCFLMLSPWQTNKEQTKTEASRKTLINRATAFHTA